MNGSLSISFLFMNAPGSPSSALHITYFWSASTLAISSHLTPVGKPAPPLPRSFDLLTSSITDSGLKLCRALYKGKNPPTAIYSSISSGTISPQLRSTIFFCHLKKGTSFQRGYSFNPLPNSYFSVIKSHSSILHKTFL